MDRGRSSRQPTRLPWTLDSFLRERASALANSLDISTCRTYSSALNSWLAFVNLHHFPIEPTEDSLSFYIVFMCHHISPRSVKSYLSGLVQQLEPDYPNIRQIRTSQLVTRTLKGCLKSHSKAIRRKEALTIHDVRFVHDRVRNPHPHDDKLFAALLVTGFHALLRLGDLTFPDDVSIRDWRKIVRRNSLIVSRDEYEFVLPMHKADKFFEGSKVLVRPFTSAFDPCIAFQCYIDSRDQLYPAASPLWLTADGSVPTRSFFISRFRRFFPNSLGGASMRAGGATYLAQLGTPSDLIRALGRWTSDAWQIYIRVHPTLLHALLHHQ